MKGLEVLTVKKVFKMEVFSGYLKFNRLDIVIDTVSWVYYNSYTLSHDLVYSQGILTTVQVLVNLIISWSWMFKKLQMFSVVWK